MTSDDPSNFAERARRRGRPTKDPQTLLPAYQEFLGAWEILKEAYSPVLGDDPYFVINNVLQNLHYPRTVNQEMVANAWTAIRQGKPPGRIFGFLSAHRDDFFYALDALMLKAQSSAVVADEIKDRFYESLVKLVTVNAKGVSSTIRRNISHAPVEISSLVSAWDALCAAYDMSFRQQAEILTEFNERPINPDVLEKKLTALYQGRSLILPYFTELAHRTQSFFDLLSQHETQRQLPLDSAGERQKVLEHFVTKLNAAITHQEAQGRWG